MLFDTHAHYDDERFSSDENPLSVDGLLQSLFAGDVKGIVNAGTNLDTCKKSIELSEKFDMMYAAVGIHPSDCFKYSDMDEVLQKIAEMSKHEKAVALGEIGLDFHYDFSPRDIQREVFIRQLRIAKSVNKPVIIHSREAAAEMFETLKKENITNGVLHCFSENAAHAEDILSLGLYIVFGGAITHKTRDELREAVKVVPMERMLIETDCPYMTPVPFRSKRNRPDYTMLTAEKIAELKNISVEEVIKTTTQNAEKLFGIKIN